MISDNANRCGFSPAVHPKAGPAVFLAMGMATGLFTVPAGATTPKAVPLRGFGDVVARFSPHRAIFRCQDAAHANILQGKLLADMFWDAGAKATIPVAIPRRLRRNLAIEGRRVPVESWRPYGAISVGRMGNEVTAVGARTIRGLRRILARQHWWRSKAVRFKPEKPYPLYLDFYDLRAFKAYVHAMSSVHGLGLSSHWPFIKRFGLGGTSFQDLSTVFQCPAPGVVQWVPADYEVAEAQRQEGLVVPGLGVGDAPLWAWNLFPQGMMRASPTALIGAWGAAGCAGDHYPSWGMDPAEREKVCWAFLQQAMDRYLHSPALGGWLLYSGAPGGEFGMHERTDIFWDYSRPGEALFRHWLREKEHESLKKLGQQWYGDANHFGAWAQVKPPDLNSFFGRLNRGCLRVRRHWEWKPAAAGSPLKPPAAKAPGWISVAMPPSEREVFLPWGAGFYRTHFHARAWLAAHHGQSVYLVCALNSRTPQGCQVWLNGRYLGAHRTRSNDGWGPFALKINGLVQPGANRLVLKVPGPEGKIFGPVFLTTSRPAYYPHLGPHLNARYADLVRWQRWANIRSLRTMLKVARTVDPNRPILISGDAGSVTDFVAALARRYGCGVEFTGDGGFYHPWWDGLGLLDRFHGTGEEGGTEHGQQLDRELGWNMMDGDGSHSLFWDLEDYMLQQRRTKWFTKHRRLIQLFGKAVRAKPQVVILRSALAMQLGDGAPWNWDIGRGELQEAHYDNAYATGRDLVNGRVQRYGAPVLFDAGTEYMSAAMIAALRRYVENGGTFIALQNTGESTLTEPNSWPISRLTGFKVVATGKSGLIRFGKSLPFFQQWAGRQFPGQGIAIDYLHVNHARKAGVGLERSGGGGTAALARWEHGGQIAVGYRKLRKGQIIVLGSTFWRNSQDVGGYWPSRSVEGAFLHRLLSDSGVRRNANASRPQVWARKFITKNGLQDWLMAFNSGREVTANVGLRVEHQPKQVWDMLTRRPVPFTYAANGWVWVHGVKFASDALRVFAVRRADLVAGLPFWWANKCFYWKKRFTISPRWRRQQSRAWKQFRAWQRRQAIGFDHWKFCADRTGRVSAGTAWRGPSFNDKAWRPLESGPWNRLVKGLAHYHGVGLYRADFTIPPSWRNRQVVLGLYSFNTPIVYDHGTFYLNGARVARYQARGWSQTLDYNITKDLRSGKNTLAVKVAGGKQFSGIGGVIWLAPQVRLQPAFSLAGRWQAVQDDYSTAKPVSLPGPAVGRYLQRQVKIPAIWAGKTVYLHVATPSQWLGSVVVNGHPINYNAYLHPYGLLADINLTPYVQFGKENQLQLWPYRGIPNPGSPGQGKQTFTVEALRLGCAGPADQGAARGRSR